MFSTLLSPLYETAFGSTTTLLLGTILLLVLVLVGISLFTLVLFRRIAYPRRNATLREAEQEAVAILDKAHKYATELREKAEKDTEALFKDREQQADAFVRRFETQIETLAKHHATLLEKYATLTRDTYREFEASVRESAGAGEAAVKQEIERLLADLHDEHTKLKRHLTKQLEDHLEQEFSAARDAVAKYREAQLRMIDRRIVSLIEEVASLALQKELSVSEHADIVFKSLEEAKKHGII